MDTNFEFQMPKNQSSVIKVLGIGGGGSNAVNYMYINGIKGVDFVVCNTDSQALEASPVPTKIQLGASLTEGLGAGSNPETGKKAAEESIDRVAELLDANTKMLFITAGMGGGTGTGAAPVIAEAAREKGILTVGVVTNPFSTEGGYRKQYAKEGLDELRKYVDTLLIINNDKLIEVYGDLTLSQAFGKANEVLNTATKGIAEVISQHLLVNIDLNDARKVLENSGTAVMGQAQATGENRAIEAVLGALDSPLLNDNDISGAEQVLLKIVTGAGDDEIKMSELNKIKNKIQEAAGSDVNIIEGIGIDPELADAVSVTVIATGFEQKIERGPVKVNLEANKKLEDVYEKPVSEQKNLNIEAHSSRNENQQRKFFNLEEDICEIDSKDSITDNFISDKRQSAEKVVFTLDYEQHSNNEEDIEGPESFIPSIEDEIGLPDSENPSIEDEIGLPDSENPSIEDEIGLPDSEIPSIDSGETPNSSFDTVEESEFDNRLNSDRQPINTDELRIEAREREDRLRTISKKLRTPSGLTDLEEEPAYKREEIELDDYPHSSDSEISKYTLSEDENKTIELKPNNPFLHDNVD